MLLMEGILKCGGMVIEDGFGFGFEVDEDEDKGEVRLLVVIVGRERMS